MHKGEEDAHAAFVGIDWADKKHDVCLQVAGSAKRERLSWSIGLVPYRLGPSACASASRERPVAVSVELSRGPFVSALLEHDFFRLFPVQPTTVANYRKARAPSGAKDDPTDAEVILELLVRHRDELKQLQPESGDMRALRRLVEWRRDLVQDRTRLTNRITDALKAYFPQVLEWFPDKEAAIFADFLERWPTLQHAQRARREKLEAFLRAGNVRRASSIEKSIQAIGEEVPLHTDAAVTRPARLLVEALLPQLRVLSAGIARFETQVAELAPRQPDYELFDALPGAGPTFAPRLLIAFGENREPFPSARSLQKSAGIAPVMERSGSNAWVHWRYSCSKFVRQTFVERAAQTIPRSVWAKAFYESCRARGARHQAGLRAPAFKWTRILHRCWLERVPYDESRYLMALQRRGHSCSSMPLKTLDSPCGHLRA
jgi:transposase